MLLLLKETLLQGRFLNDNESNYLKNVECLLAYKKSSGNVIKFASQNMPCSIIQVWNSLIHLIMIWDLLAYLFVLN